MHAPAPRRAFLAAAVPAALLLSACSTAGGAADPFRGGAGSNSIRIEVTNLNFNDATLHALRGGDRHRLGVVGGKGSASYTMPWTMPMPLRIEIDLLAGDDCVTRALQVDPGEVVQLQIEMDLRRDPDCYRR